MEQVKIRLVTVRRLKEKYLIQDISEYLRRLNSYTKVEIIEVPDEKAPEKLSGAEMLQVKEKEGQRILGRINDNEYVFILTIGGKQLSSEEFSEEIKQLGISGKNNLTLVIGGSLGLSDSVLQRSNQQIFFGRSTCPHQLMCLVLVRQIYRSFQIMKEKPYHRQEIGWLLSKFYESSHYLKNIRSRISLVYLSDRK